MFCSEGDILCSAWPIGGGAKDILRTTSFLIPCIIDH